MEPISGLVGKRPCVISGLEIINVINRQNCDYGLSVETKFVPDPHDAVVM